jgi:hypothetical protein
MSVSLYDSSVPVYRQMLGALDAILDKAAAHFGAKKVSDATLLATRLIPDMFTLARQVQIACDHAKNGPARLAGVEPPRFEDAEATIPELKARIAKVLAYLDTIDKAAIEAGATRLVQFPIGPERRAEMVGADYLLHYSLPNFYFHLTTAYAILRAAGLDIGKRDYLGAVKGFKPL